MYDNNGYKGKLVGLVVAFALFGILFLTNPTVSEDAETAKIAKNYEDTSYEGMENIFAPGEHIISVPIEEDIRVDNFQYEYHPGYKPVGFAVSAHGKSSNIYSGGVIVYVNTLEVQAKVTGKNYDGEALFTEFGEPLNYIEEDKNDNEFLLGEHIISMPIEDEIYDENVQLLSVDGYDVIGIATSNYGQTFHYGGGAVLLVNNTTVKCEPYEDEMGNIVYNKVGKPTDTKKLNLK